MRFAILENGKLGAAVEGELGRSMLRKKGVQAVRGKFNVEDGKPRIGIHCELIGGATDDLRCGFERRNCNKIVVVWEPGEPISKGMDAIHIKKQA